MKKEFKGMILMCLLGDVAWPSCGTNPGGLYDGGFFGEIEDVETWPAPLAVPVAIGDRVKYLGDFEMKTGKRMYQLYTTKDTAEVSDESVGEFDGKSFESSYEGFTPGTEAETLEWAMTVNNGNFFFVPRERDGKYRIIGGPGNPAKIDTLSIKTGKDAKGRKGCTFKFKAWGLGPAPIYVTGTIPLTPAA